MNERTDHSTEAGISERKTGGSDRRATVLQVLPALGQGGGVERGTVEVARAIVEAGGRALVASAGGIMVHDLTRAGAEHFEMPVDSKNPIVMESNVGRLARLIEAEKVDIVHARSRAPAWSAWRAARRTATPFITTFHGTYSHGNWFKRWYNSVMTRGERVIAISGFIAGHVRRIYGVPSESIRVIHRGVDLNSFDPAKVTAERVAKLSEDWRLDGGLPVVMLPGRLTRWKGQGVFIEAVSKMKRRDIRCLLVGSDQGREDYRRELENRVHDSGLAEIVRIVDHCADMPAAYMLTDVVVSASTDPEAFGRVVIEAQALGRPVIATDHGGAKETVIVGETGWLTPPGDADALARALDSVLELDAAARQKLSQKAVANVRKNFSRQAMCDKTLEVYDEVLAQQAEQEAKADR